MLTLLLLFTLPFLALGCGFCLTYLFSQWLFTHFRKPSPSPSPPSPSSSSPLDN